MNGYLGIDTSCYTTSAAFLNSDGQLLADCRKLLQVKPGGRGLAQSEMVFQHMRNLPSLIEEVADTLGGKLPDGIAIGVSVSPRAIPESYMPAFVAGESFARVLSVACKAPVYRLSHQENHIFAGIRCVGWPTKSEFLAVHISGGTTEIVKVTIAKSKLCVDIVGQSHDLHAGQFVDRVGVALGLPFPAGPHLEQLASKAVGNVDIPFSCSGANVSFSGPETFVQRLISAGKACPELAAGVQQCIAKSITAMIISAIGQTGCNEVVVVGGVSANSYIRSFLTDQMAKRNIAIMFPDHHYSSDNATGSAYFAFWSCTQDTASA